MSETGLTVGCLLPARSACLLWRCKKIERRSSENRHNFVAAVVTDVRPASGLRLVQPLRGRSLFSQRRRRRFRGLTVATVKSLCIGAGLLVDV